MRPKHPLIKIITLFIGFCLAVTGGAVTGNLISYADAGLGISVYVANQRVVFPDAQPRMSSEQRVLVPLRFVSQALGAEVLWFADSQKAILKKGTITLELTIGKKSVLANGKPVPVDTSPALIGGRAFVPLRFPAQFFGSKVEWIANQQVVLIDSSLPAHIDTSVPNNTRDDFTLLIYMNGTDLESEYDAETNQLNGAGTADLAELMAIGSSARINLIVETGGTKAWINPNIDPKQNQRWRISKGALEKLDNLGKKNMGASQTLADFVKWGIQAYPAQHYGLILWNHGGGPIVGYGLDELYDGDTLLLTELDTALAQSKLSTGVDFEFIGFDACLMASLETANTVAPYAKYLVASQELEPGHGWNYTAIAKHLVSGAPTTGAAIGKAIADSFEQQAVANATEADITLSVVELAKLDPINAALEELSLSLSSAIAADDGMMEVTKRLSDIKSFGVNTPDEGYTDLVDLGQLATSFESYEPAASKALMQALQGAIAYQIRGPVNSSATGLSLFLPNRDQAGFKDNLEIQSQIKLPKAVLSFSRAYAKKVDMTPSIASRISEITVLAPREPQGPYSLQVADSLLPDIAQIYLGIYEKVKTPKLYYRSLGYDILALYNRGTGNYDDDFNGFWTTLEGKPLRLRIIYDGGDTIEYETPMLLNGVRVSLESVWFFDDDYELGGYYEIVGARRINPNNQMPDKNLIRLKIGDEIQLIYDSYYPDTKSWSEEVSPPFVLRKAPKLDFTQLKSTEFLITFMLFDVAGRYLETDFYTK